MTQTLRLKIAAEPWEFEQINRLNYETFVEEIPQHRPDASRTLVDKFHKENTYIICTDDEKPASPAKPSASPRGERGELLGMLAVRGKRPFSLDEKLPDLDSYLPRNRSVCEIRLLAVRKDYRHSRIFRDLIAKAVDHCRRRGHDLAVISGVLGQKKLYEHLGFIPFGPVVGTGQARFQPMYLTIEAYEMSIREVIEPRPSNSAAKKMILLPGPVDIAPNVRRVFNESTISHRSQEFLKIHEETRNLLCRLVNAKNVEIFMGSGTLANDVIAAQLSLKPEKGLVLSNGEFGQRLIGQAKRFALSFETLSVDWGKSFHPDAIRKIAGQHPDIKWLWAIHCETSTGMLNDVKMLKQICNERGISLCLDCVSSIGTVAVDLQGVRYASGVSGKGLRSFSGLSMVFYEEAPRQSDKILPAYLDLADYRRKDGIPFTISSNLVYALYEAVRTIDMDKKIANTESVSVWLKNGLRNMGLCPIIPDNKANPAIITLALPAQLDSEKVATILDSKGFSISYRSGYLLERNWIQICLTGDFSREALRPLLTILRQILSC